MYLNLFSIIERSQFNIHNSFCRDTEVFDIDSIRLLSPDTQPQVHSLCLVDSTALHEIRDLPVHVISNAPIDIDEDESSFLSYSYVEHDSLDTLAIDLKDVMIRYYGQISDAHSAIIGQSSLHEIFDTAARLLRNPVALFDNNQNMLCHSASDESVRQFSLWDYALSYGYSPELSDENTLIKLFRDKRTPFYFRSSDDNGDTIRMITPIYFRNYLFGCLGSVNSSESFTHCDFADSCIVQKLIEQALQNSNEFDLNIERVPWYILQALRGKEINDSVASYNLKKTGHSFYDPYRVLTFQQSSAEADSSTLSVSEIAPEIAFLYPDALTYCYNNQIVVIDYSDTDLADHAFSTKLVKVLRRLCLNCGESMVFREFSALHQAFMQSLVAVRYADTEKPVSFNRCITAFIRDSLRKENEHDGLIYPGIQNLLRKDPEYGKELIRCLEIYILNGCNTTATSKELFLHRNTVIYRLEQIQKLFNLDFEHLTKAERLLLILTCEMLLADSPS